MCLEIGLYIRVVKQLYNMTLEALEASLLHKNQSKALKVALKLFCVVGAVALSVSLSVPVCTFIVKYINAQQKEKEWIDGMEI